MERPSEISGYGSSTNTIQGGSDSNLESRDTVFAGTFKSPIRDSTAFIPSSLSPIRDSVFDTSNLPKHVHDPTSDLGSRVGSRAGSRAGSKGFPSFGGPPRGPGANPPTIGYSASNFGRPDRSKAECQMINRIQKLVKLCRGDLPENSDLLNYP